MPETRPPQNSSSAATRSQLSTRTGSASVPQTPAKAMRASMVRRSFIRSESRPIGIWKTMLPIPMTVSSSAACDSLKPSRVA
ncbi:hypothetical protein D3C86_1699940 [compost metagenome]